MARHRELVNPSDFLYFIPQLPKHLHISCQRCGIAGYIHDAVRLHAGHGVEEVFFAAFSRRIDDDDVRVGVFASRSPFRPNGLGLSSVHADATLGFTATNADYGVEVDLPDTLAVLVPADKLAALVGVLAQDPRPAVGRDPERVHGVEFAGLNVRFRVARGVLHVVEVHPLG